MNQNIVEGKFHQIKGKAKRAIGKAIGNKRLANSGAVDQVKGTAKVVWGNIKEAAHAVAKRMKDAKASRICRNERKSAAKARNTRQRITSTAQNVKDVVSAKAVVL
ncbi:MAG: CsbD family protein [Acidobacteriaceae bacterium]|nr:CsbD family protein [Acidobacteriaceae bacterium]